MKICKDIRCDMGNREQSLNNFPRDRRSDDGRYIYCRACCSRRGREIRAAKGAKQYQKAQRKPNVIATSPFAFSLVYDAIKSGSRTREQIRRETKLDYDSIGEAILELWEVKGIRIQRLPENKREFVEA